MAALGDLYDFDKQDRFYRRWTVASFVVTLGAWFAGMIFTTGPLQLLWASLAAGVATWLTNVPVTWYLAHRRARRTRAQP